MERLAEDDDEHRAVRELADPGDELHGVRRAEQRRELLRGGLRAGHARVEIHLGAEVVVARRVGALAVRRLGHLVAALREDVARARRSTLDAVPVQDEHARLPGGRRLHLHLLTEGDLCRLLRRADVRVTELAHGPLDVVGRRRQVVEPFDPVDPRLERVARRQ